MKIRLSLSLFQTIVMEAATATENKTHDVVVAVEDGGGRRSSGDSGAEIVEKGCPATADLECGEEKAHLEREERDCRICHLSLDAANHETGIPIELGCSCKDDLAAAHKHCAEAWFKIKGNK